MNKAVCKSDHTAKAKWWVVLYREGGARKYETLGLFSKMSKSDAQQKQAEFMNEVNAKLAIDPDPQITFGEFLDAAALPFLRSKWKRSTASTTEDRMSYHLAEFRDTRLRAIPLKTLQAFLNEKPRDCLAAQWRICVGICALFKLALAEGFIDRDPTAALYTPKEAAVEPTRAMTRKEVEQYLTALEFRERVIAHLAIFTGMRPGEILGLQREHVSADCRSIIIKQRIYRGDIDTPKTTMSRRMVAVPPKTACL
jgi:integrase